MRASYDQGRTAARAVVEPRAPEPAADHDPSERATILVVNATRHHALIAARCVAMTDAASVEDWDAAHDDAQRGLGELRALCRRSALAQRADGSGSDAPRAEAARAAAALLAAAEQAVATAPPRPARAGAAFARTDEVVACFARAGEASAREGFAQVEQQFRDLLPTLSAVELRQLRDATQDVEHPVARALATVTSERRARMTEALFSPKLAFAAAAHGSIREFDVTGAASRYAPPEWVGGSEKVSRAIVEARDVDAPAESGNFDGGFVSSATQAARYGRVRRETLTRDRVRGP